MRTDTMCLFLVNKEYYVAACDMKYAISVFQAQTEGDSVGSIEAVGTVIVEDKSPEVISGKDIRRHQIVLTNHDERFIAGLEEISEYFSRVKPEETMEHDSYEAEDLPNGLNIDDAVKERMRQALETANGNGKIAAKLMGISERTLYRWKHKYNL